MLIEILPWFFLYRAASRNQWNSENQIHIKSKSNPHTYTYNKWFKIFLWKKYINNWRIGCYNFNIFWLSFGQVQGWFEIKVGPCVTLRPTGAVRYYVSWCVDFKLSVARPSSFVKPFHYLPRLSRTRVESFLTSVIFFHRFQKAQPILRSYYPP